LYLDRYLISLFVSLELTGAYTFFWSFANVVHALAIYGVLTPQISRLVAAGSHESEEAFLDAERRVMIETASWALLLSAILCASVPWTLAFIGRPLLTANLSIFWIVIIATLMRVGADAYGYALYALRCDKTIAWTSMAATASSACLNFLLIPYLGIKGAACAFLLTATMQFGARLLLTRRRSSLRLKHGHTREVGAAFSTVPTAGGR
jgi:O-antigen/teichoic acid export membrane protein